jgi:hypothetical protein
MRRRLGPYIAAVTALLVTAALAALLIPFWWGLSSPANQWSEAILDAWRSFRGPR